MPPTAPLPAVQAQSFQQEIELSDAGGIDTAADGVRENQKKAALSQMRFLSRARPVRVPMNGLFVAAGLLSLISAIVSGYFLYAFSMETVTETLLSGGRSEVEAVSARVVPEIDIMEMHLTEMISAAFSQMEVIPTIPDLPAAYTAGINASLLWGWPSKVLSENSISGFEFDMLFPPANSIAETKVAYVMNFYEEPDRQGDSHYTYLWTLPGTQTLQWFNASFSTSTRSIRVHWNEMAKSREITIASTFQSEPHADDGSFVYQPIQAWASTYDGMPYWYLTLYSYIKLDGKYTCLTVYKNLLRLETLILKSLGVSSTTTNAQQVLSTVYLYEPVQRVILGTTFDPERVRQENCYQNFTQFTNDYSEPTCMYLPVELNPHPQIRSLFNVIRRPEWENPNNLNLTGTTSSVVNVEGTRLFVVSKLIVNRGATRLMLIWTRDAGDLFRLFQGRVATIIGVCCVCIILSAVVFILISIFALLRPIDVLAQDMDCLASLDTEDLESTKRETRSYIKEVYALQSRFTSMATAMHSFAVYVPRDVVKEMLLSDGGMASLGMQVRHLVVAFADVADFTTLCERFSQDPATLSQILTTFFRKATQSLMRYGATIDKFIGDAIMCFWGAPLAIDEPELRAICGGLALLRLCPAISHGFAHLNVTIRMRIGIHSGQCLCGNIGSELRMNYTALGDVVNTASRMEGLNKQFKSSLMVSGKVLADCIQADRFLCRRLGAIVAKGKSEAIEGYEIFAVLSLPMDSMDMLPDEWADLCSASVSGSRSRSPQGTPVGQPLIGGGGASKMTSVLPARLASNAKLTRDQSREVEQIYRHRGSDLLDPDAALRSVESAIDSNLRVGTSVDRALVAACRRNDDGIDFFNQKRFEEALEEFKNGRELLSRSKSTALSAGFLESLKIWEGRATRGIQGEDVKTTFVAESK
jgi:class 3 adenylate cyclase